MALRPPKDGLGDQDVAGSRDRSGGRDATGGQDGAGGRDATGGQDGAGGRDATGGRGIAGGPAWVARPPPEGRPLARVGRVPTPIVRTRATVDVPKGRYDWVAVRQEGVVAQAGMEEPLAGPEGDTFTSNMVVPETSSTRTSVSREESNRTVESRSRRRKLPGVRSSSRRPRPVVTL